MWSAWTGDEQELSLNKQSSLTASGDRAPPPLHFFSLRVKVAFLFLATQRRSLVDKVRVTYTS